MLKKISVQSVNLEKKKLKNLTISDWRSTTESIWPQKLNLEKIFKTESMWKLNFKGHKNKKKTL